MQNQRQGTAWPKKRRLIGTEIQRLDGAVKSTGLAKYSYDINRPGLLHAVILRCPLAHATLESLDTAEAEKMPGVKGIYLIAKPGQELYYAGEEILALAADTEDHARDAVRAVKVSYKPLPFLVKEEDALDAPDQKTVGGLGKNNLTIGTEAVKLEDGVSSIEEAFKKADAVVEADYGVPVICHQCLEPHGMVAEWEGTDKLTVWCSVQATKNVARDLANHFKIPQTQVNCITHYMGAGYGSKFGADIQGIACAELAKQTGAPVKLMLDREAEITTAGNRPSAYGRVRIAGNKDGKLVAFDVDCYGTPGYSGGATVNLGLLPYVYEIPNYRRKHSVVRVNAGRARAMRAPGHPQNCVLTDSAVEDIAAKLGLDPMEVRLKNLPPNDTEVAKNNPLAWQGMRQSVYTKQIEIAAKLANWKEKWHPPGQGPNKGPIKHGIGMAIHTWGGQAQGGDPPLNDCTVIIARDGSITAQTSTQDLGTGQRTVTAIVVAEVFGMQPEDIVTRIGESIYGGSTGSGGSTTCPSQAPAALRAAYAARDQLFAKIAPKLGAKAEDLRLEGGKVVDSASGKSWSFKEACSRLGMDEVKATEGWSSILANQPENAGVSNVFVGGVQIAEVEVDTETGLVRPLHIVAVQDCGMVVNKLCCESQVAGGVIMGANYALLEERIMDRHTGRQVNPDMEFYKLGAIKDLPKITVHMYDMPERGVIGIGEPPTISTCAAIGNAIHNALGVRVPHAPFTADRVLAALEKKGGKA